jgi:hypothetical protein
MFGNGITDDYKESVYHYYYTGVMANYDPWPLEIFLFGHQVGLPAGEEWGPAARPLSTQYSKTQKKIRQTSKPRVGFGPTIPVFELSRPTSQKMF